MNQKLNLLLTLFFYVLVSCKNEQGGTTSVGNPITSPPPSYSNRCEELLIGSNWNEVESIFLNFSDHKSIVACKVDSTIIDLESLKSLGKMPRSLAVESFLLSTIYDTDADFKKYCEDVGGVLENAINETTNVFCVFNDNSLMDIKSLAEGISKNDRLAKYLNKF